MKRVNVDFYITGDDPRKLVKNMTPTTSATDARITGQMSIQAPVLSLGYNAMIAGSTHAYIAEWGRWYKIESATVNNAERMILSLLVDAKQTWGEALKGCPATCVRSESVGMNMTPDTQAPVMPGAEYVTTVQFDSSDLDSYTGPGDYYYVLTVK